MQAHFIAAGIACFSDLSFTSLARINHIWLCFYNMSPFFYSLNGSLPMSMVVSSALHNFQARRFYLSSRNYKIKIYIHTQETSVGAHVSFMHANLSMS